MTLTDRALLTAIVALSTASFADVVMGGPVQLPEGVTVPDSVVVDTTHGDSTELKLQLEKLRSASNSNLDSSSVARHNPVATFKTIADALR